MNARGARDADPHLEEVPMRAFVGLAVATLMAPGNRLERLRGVRAGQHSIRINDQYRVCFRWEGGYADQVEVTDYH